MQAEDMEVPIINNLNDNGDRLRPKGKDAFKEPQKESEVNLGGGWCAVMQCRNASEPCVPSV